MMKVTNNISVTVGQKSVQHIRTQVKQTPPKSINRQQVMSLLPNDYANLINLPKINGVEIKGELSTKELSILAADKDYYTTVDLTQEDISDKYILGIDNENNTIKMPIESASDAMAVIKTSGEMNSEVRIGTYQFVEKKNEG